MIDLRLGDCLEILKTLPDNSVDSVVVDPPYGIGFMNKEWDSPQKHKELIDREAKRSQERFDDGKSPVKGGFSKGVQPGLAIGGAKEGRWFQEWCELWGAECLRVLKPGGYILSFSAPRTYHRMATAFEEVGFQVRDQIMWIFGSGFPKSHNIGKAIQKQSGDVKVVGKKTGMGTTGNSYVSNNEEYIGGDKGVYKKEYDDIEINNQWEGWGTALKPAHEPICMARKPLSEKSIAENVLRWGTGGINIDVSRIGVSDNEKVKTEGHIRKGNVIGDERTSVAAGQFGDGAFVAGTDLTNGRFPANIMFECICDELIDGKEIKGNENYNWNNTDTESNTFTNRGTYTPRTETPKIHTNQNCPCYMLDEQSGVKKSIKRGEKYNKEYDNTNTATKLTPGKTDGNTYADKGGASRFFYSAKVSKKERNAGLDGKVEIFTPTIKLVYLLENNIWEKEDLKTKLVDTDKSLQKVIDESIIMEDNKWNIESFGNYIMEQFQKEHKSITETEINSTTIYQTLNLWIQNHTRTYIAELFGEKVKDIKFVENVEQRSTTLNITIQNKDGYSPSVKNVELINLWNINIVPSKSSHPTVKPIALMEYLIKMVTPKGGTTLDCFMGSGSTGIAAKNLGMNFIGIEKEQEYMDIAKQRINYED